jgi:hypothetical protein
VLDVRITGTSGFKEGCHPSFLGININCISDINLVYDCKLCGFEYHGMLQDDYRLLP